MKHHLKHIRKGTPITVEIHKPHIRFGNEKKALATMQMATMKHTGKRRGRTAPRAAKEILQPYKALPKSKGTADATALPYM